MPTPTFRWNEEALRFEKTVLPQPPTVHEVFDAYRAMTAAEEVFIKAYTEDPKRNGIEAK